MKCPKCHSDQTRFDGSRALYGGITDFDFFICQACGSEFVENPETEGGSEKKGIPTREELLKKIRWQHQLEDTRQAKVDELLTLPILKALPLYKNLREIIKTGTAGPKDYEALLSADAAVSEKLRALVNSPLFGLEPKVRTLAEVFERLEPGEVAALVLAIEALTTLRPPAALPNFWLHGLTCGLAARGIARLLVLPNANGFFPAGLLVDIGRLAIAEQSPQVTQEIQKQSRKTKQPLFVMEEQLLEFNHAQAGGSLLKSWMADDWMVQAVRYHHHPLEAKGNKQSACILHVADIIAYDLNRETGPDAIPPQVDPDAIKSLGLTRSFIQNLKKEIEFLKGALKPILISCSGRSVPDSASAP